jgi:hypothetical protein
MTAEIIAHFVISYCSRKTNISRVNTKKDCLAYMRTCTFNPDIIGTPDYQTNGLVTLESRYEDCTVWWKQQLRK